MAQSTFFCHQDDQECYGLLFEIETFLRTAVRWELRGKSPFDWLGLLSEETLKEARSRLEQERNIGYLDTRSSGLLSYLTIAELKEILLGPLWESCFRAYWPPQDVVKSEFKKLLAIRNKVAHFRPVTRRDLRVAQRFTEDLADWTRNYRRIRDAAVGIEKGKKAEKILIEQELRHLPDFWSNLLKNGFAEKHEVSIKFVGHHVAMEGSVVGGSIDPASFLKFVGGHEKALSFCRVGELGEKLCCYVPIKLGDDTVTETFKEMLSVISTIVEGMSSDDVRLSFKFAEREGVMPWNIDLPIDFKLSS